MDGRQRDEKSTFTVLITGANSGLGFATACRICDEFLATRPPSQTLHLIITTRSARKNTDTLTRIRTHVQKTLTNVYGRDARIRTALRDRIKLEGEIADLTKLRTVVDLAGRLLARGRGAQNGSDGSLPDQAFKIDALILNAGIGGWSGLNWPVAIWDVITDTVHATTYPRYQKGMTGRVTGRQIEKKVSFSEPDATESSKSPSGVKIFKISGDGKVAGQRNIPEPGQQPSSPRAGSEPKLGETFTANVFGHYMLAHKLMPLLWSDAGSSRSPGRVIWVGSVTAHASVFSLDDIQALQSNRTYDSSKRLTDLLVLTSDLPSTKKSVDQFTQDQALSKSTSQSSQSSTQPPEMFVCHPGICATAIADLPFPLQFVMMFACYIARWLGSPWHPIDAYLGAVSSVWLALSPQDTLDHLHDSSEGGGKSKWGSSTDVMGNERILRTDVEGWKWTGDVDEKADGGMKLSKGRRRGLKDTTREMRDEFETVGRNAWSQMEALRIEWEARLDVRPL